MKSPIVIVLLLVTVISLPVMAVNIKTVSADTLIYDNFDDGIADGWTPQIGSWSVIGGEYFISVGMVENGISTVDGFYLTDCTIETKFRFTDNVGYRAGLVFRYMKKDTYYSLELSNEYDALCFVKYLPECAAYGTQDHGFVGISPTEIHFGSGELSVGRRVINSTQIARIDKGVDYTLRVTTKGDVFVGELISDGFYQKIVWKDTDNPFNYGTVGLRARRADVNFDYFKIENATISEIKPPEPLNPELMAWWKLDEGSGTVVSDSSGYEHHGTINGANWLNYQGDSTLNFDGKSDYVSLPSLNLANLDSLTVVAWINSDLTKVGYIYAHGDDGVFELSNGHFSNGRLPEIDNTIARFGVKLYPSGWYDALSASHLEPNRWHQLVGVWVKGDSVKVYVDGVLAGEVDNIPSEPLEDAGTSFPSSLGIYSQNRWNIDTFFKGQISNAMVFNKALTVQEINALYDDVTIPTVARPILDVSCKSSTSTSGFNVEINGDLTLEGTAVPDAPVLLSYSVNAGKSWEDLTLVYTGSDGRYSATWLPSVTGSYLLKAYYEGDINNLPASSQINFAVTTVTEENAIFSVSSNSTVTALQFNSTISELSFTVSGPSGTKGYVKCAIAKSLVSNPENIKLFLDGNQLSYDITSTEDSWLLSFTYSHSSHRISINLPTDAIEVILTDQNHWIWVTAASITTVIAISLLVYLKKRQHKA